MNRYITVQQGTIKSTPHDCFTKVKLPDGQIITNFDKLTDSEKAQYGEFKYVESLPTINREMQWYTDKQVTISATTVNVTYAVGNKPIEECKRIQIEKVYRKAKELLDISAGTRSSVEIADWPLLKQDILQYLEDSTVGPMLLNAINRSNYDVNGLVTTFLPKISYENDIITTRSAHTAVIQSLQSVQEVIDYDIYATEQSLIQYEIDGTSIPVDSSLNETQIVWPSPK